METKFEVKVLTTPEYLRILKDEQLITFAVFVDELEVHHQISILEYDTREKIEKKMAEIGAQVCDELRNSGNLNRNKPIPQDIQALVDSHKLE